MAIGTTADDSRSQHLDRLSILGKYMASSTWARARWRFGHTEFDSGSTHRGLRLDQSLAYVQRVFDDYSNVGGLTLDVLRGSRVLEVGPGDNLGVALCFIAAGSAKVVCVDRCHSRRDPAEEQLIYAALRQKLGGAATGALDSVMDEQGHLMQGSGALHYVAGVDIANAATVANGGSFDCIVSRAVLEEIWELDRAFVAMDHLLKPGGWMVHRVDLRDYGMFSKRGFHPLEFLTIPDHLYRWIAKGVGRPNRRRIDYYRSMTAKLGYRTKIYVTRIAGHDEELVPRRERLVYGQDYDASTLALIQSIRPRLARPFRRLADSDLMIAGIFLVAQKGCGNPGA